MTAPTAKTCRLVDTRDKRSCRRCGASLEHVAGSRHHRKRRQVGGHEVSNLVLLCGSGTTGCHGWAHANPSMARAEGLVLLANGIGEPTVIPVRVHDPQTPKGYRWVQFDDLGNEETINENDALELLWLFGQIETVAA